MMKKIILLFIINLVAVAIQAGELTAKADSAYAGKNYVEAVQLYQAEIDSVGPTSALYYNIGNCYYRMGSQGRAILNYERALKMNPRNADAIANLDFINSRLTDRPGERGTFLDNVGNSIASVMSANLWAVVGVVAFALVGIGILLYFFVENIAVRKIGFFGAGVMLVVVIVSVLFGLRAASNATATNRAVVLVQSTILSTVPRTPSSSAEEAMMLHEGAVVTILDEVIVTSGDKEIIWLDVEFDNNHRAWIDASAVERI